MSRFMWHDGDVTKRTPEEIMADAVEVLNDPDLSDEMRYELVDVLSTTYNGPSIAGTTMVPNPDGYLAVGDIEGDAVKEQILADFLDQLYEGDPHE